jgi:polyhydroxybutyrate depolymerase
MRLRPRTSSFKSPLLAIVVLFFGAAGASLTLAACGDDRAPAPSAPSSPQAPPPPPSSPSAPRDLTLTFSFGGFGRTVSVHLPSLPPRTAATAPVPLALVLDLHASGGTAAGRQSASGLAAVADREGFVVAYPQGAIAYAGGFQWHVPHQPLVDGAPEPAGPDDVAFLAEAIRRVSTAVQAEGGAEIDPRRVYATGFSGGARMASSAGCELVELAAIAPISGLRFPAPCARDDISILAFHGTADPTNTYDGSGSSPYWTYGIPAALDRWRQHLGCPAASSSRPAASVELSVAHGCRGGASVELYSLEGEGHEAPRAVAANELMWSFFRAHPHP